MKDEIIVFIFEGEKRERELVENVTSLFLKGKYQALFLHLPANQNCYMLWQKLKEDEFDTDIIELIRESNLDAAEKLRGISRQQIDQIFMFFDYDPHQNNLPADIDFNSVMCEMIETFDNETENGKLYISYPMIEAIRDFSDLQCEAFYKCYVDKEDINDYKTKSGDRNPYAQLNKYTIKSWERILHVFCWRISCLFEIDSLTYEFYKHEITPQSIFCKEKQLYLNDKCFVLSAIPEFLFDYFSTAFWRKYYVKHNAHRKECEIIVH